MAISILSPNNCDSKSVLSAISLYVFLKAGVTISNMTLFIPAFMAAGESFIRSLPLFIITMVLKRSASSIYGVDITIVTPSLCNSESIFQKSRRETGSTPVVGSSRKIILGLCISVQASASFCFIPPESFPARNLRNLVRRVNSRSSFLLSLKFFTPCSSAKNSIFSSMVKSAYRLNFCDKYPISSLILPVCFSRSNPSRFAVPLSGFTRPQSILINVVLPAPSGPTIPKTSFLSTLKEISFTAISLSNALVNPLISIACSVIF